MKTFEIPKGQCPRCNLGLNGCTNLEGVSAPEEGNLTVCIQCATILVFARGEAGHLALRLAKEADLEGLPIETSLLLWRTQQGIRRVQQQHHRKGVTHADDKEDRN